MGLPGRIGQSGFPPFFFKTYPPDRWTVLQINCLQLKWLNDSFAQESFLRFTGLKENERQKLQIRKSSPRFSSLPPWAFLSTGTSR